MNIRLQGKSSYSTGYLREMVSGHKVSEIVFAAQDVQGGNGLLSAVVNVTLQTKDKTHKIIDGLTINELMTIANVKGGIGTVDNGSFNFSITMGDGNAIYLNEDEQMYIALSWSVGTLTAGNIQVGTIEKDSDAELYIPYYQKNTVSFTGSGQLQSVMVGNENPNLILVDDPDVAVDNIELQRENTVAGATRALYIAHTVSQYPIENSVPPDFFVVLDDSSLITSVESNPMLRIASYDTGTVTILQSGFILEPDRSETKAELHNHEMITKLEKVERKFPARARALRNIGYTPHSTELR